MKKTLRNILDALCNLFKPHPKNELPKIGPYEPNLGNDQKPDDMSQKPESKAKDLTPWMTIVEKDAKDKVAEIPGSKNHPVIVEAHEIAGLRPEQRNDLTAWCASYAKRAFVKAGVSRERLKDFKAWARDMLKFGVKSEFKYGCVMVFERNEPGGDSHVTFGVRQENDYYVCIGGNQGNAVKESKYHKDDLLGIRWPDQEMLKEMGL